MCTCFLKKKKKTYIESKDIYINLKMESFVTLYIRTNKCFVNEEIFLYKYWHVYAYFLGNACFSKWPVSWCEEICDNLHGRGLVSKTGCKQINYYVYVTYELQYMYIILINCYTWSCCIQIAIHVYLNYKMLFMCYQKKL